MYTVVSTYTQWEKVSSTVSGSFRLPEAQRLSHRPSYSAETPRAITPSVDFLPPEILALIFLAARPRRRSRYNIPFEVLLSHVSTRWRAVALGTPSLWVNIDIYSFRSLQCTSSYLERSNPCPITVRIDIWDSDRIHTCDPALTLDVINLAIQHAARWRCLLLFTYHWRTAENVLSHLSNVTAPLLRRLRIAVCVEGSTPRAERRETRNRIAIQADVFELG